ncbi:MAG: hypothetical protein KIS96_12600 [Bauldia sp.]|nr:hypothetical protein [Bauldia sp.]
MTVFASIADPAELDAAVRGRLAESLAYLVAKAGPELGTDDARLAPVVAALRDRQVHPGVFARYYDLVPALRSGGFDRAAALMDEILVLAGEPVAFAVAPFSPDELGDDAERFARLMFAEMPGPSPVLPPGDAFPAAADHLGAARAVIAAVDPAIEREVAALLSRVYVGVGNPDPAARGFGGVTSFMVWGATLVNSDGHRSVPRMAEFLVHEITHALLFGIAAAEPLVLNPPHETYASPLRKDPRPMDGVFHAMVVCARLIEFFRSWLAGGEGEDAPAVRDRIADLTPRFLDGHRLVGDQARLSERGRHIHELAAQAAAGG